MINLMMAMDDDDDNDDDDDVDDAEEGEEEEEEEEDGGGGGGGGGGAVIVFISLCRVRFRSLYLGAQITWKFITKSPGHVLFTLQVTWTPSHLAKSQVTLVTDLRQLGCI